MVMTPAIRALIADLHATDDRSPEAMRAIYQRHLPAPSTSAIYQRHRSELLASG